MASSEGTSNKVRAPFLECLRRLQKGRGGKPEYLSDSCDGFDLHFICSEGAIVSAHRLVISNVSKYIMTMLDDQPPWYPTCIHVEDLPENIVQILVDLAYTGEMSFPEELQSDVFDAMQTLGWIHTDCLSAAYIDIGRAVEESPPPAPAKIPKAVTPPRAQPKVEAPKKKPKPKDLPLDEISQSSESSSVAEGQGDAKAEQSEDSLSSPSKRQRRKPKRFEDMEEIPEKRRASPTKASPAKLQPPSPAKAEKAEKTESVDPAPVKAKRGRPKATPVPEEAEGKANSAEPQNSNGTPRQVKKAVKKEPTPRKPVKEKDDKATEAETIPAKPTAAADAKPAKAAAKKKLSSDGSRTSLITNYFNTATTAPAKPEAEEPEVSIVENGEGAPKPGAAQKKKRTFDQINEAVNSSDKEQREEGDGDSEDLTAGRPRRKSMRDRNSSKSLETDPGKEEEGEEPDKKRKRKNTDKGEPAVLEDSNGAPTAPALPARRPSKK